MNGYRKPSGVYIEVQDGTPVSTALVEVALRPSLGHVLSDTWHSDPMNPAVCWRVKTAAEITSEKDAALQAFLDSTGGLVVKSLATALIKKGTVTLAEIRGEYRSLAS